MPDGISYVFLPMNVVKYLLSRMVRNRWTDRRWVCKNSAVYSESESSSELKHVCILHFYYTESVSIRILKLAYVCSVSYGNASFRLFRSVTNDCTAP